jgi:MFS family permease
MASRCLPPGGPDAGSVAGVSGVRPPAEGDASIAAGDGSKIRKTLLYSILDGVGYSIMVGAGETYFIPYALFLGASNLTLGLFVALPIMVGSLSQVFSQQILRILGTRKRVICVFVSLQVLAFVPIILVRGIDSPWRAQVLLGAVCFYWACGLIVGPSWSSLMGDIVPETERGAYFGRRSRYTQISTFLGLVAAGCVLFALKVRGLEYAGFVSIFAIAALSRAVSLIFLFLHWDPPVESPPTRRAVSAVVETLRNPHQRFLILYLTLMNFGVYLAAPFFSAYMLRPLSEDGREWSYVTYMGINGITLFFKFVFLTLWGEAADRFGSRKCLVLAAWVVCVLPLAWLFPAGNDSLYFAVICIVQVVGGFAWAGHELCAFNFLLDSAHSAERPALVASMNIVNGVMVFLGSMAGALVVSVAPDFLNPFLLVFLLSSLARFVACSTLLHRLHEVRIVEKISYRSLFFRVSSVRANMGPVMRFFVLPVKRRQGP